MNHPIIFIFLQSSNNLKELYNIRLKNKECKSINTILSFYKGIQYKLPSQSFSKKDNYYGIIDLNLWAFSIDVKMFI